VRVFSCATAIIELKQTAARKIVGSKNFLYIAINFFDSK